MLIQDRGIDVNVAAGCTVREARWAGPTFFRTSFAVKAGGFADQKLVSTSILRPGRTIYTCWLSMVVVSPPMFEYNHGYTLRAMVLFRRFWFGGLERKPFHGIRM